MFATSQLFVALWRAAPAIPWLANTWGVPPEQYSWTFFVWDLGHISKYVAAFIFSDKLAGMLAGRALNTNSHFNLGHHGRGVALGLSGLFVVLGTLEFALLQLANNIEFYVNPDAMSLWNPQNLVRLANVGFYLGLGLLLILLGRGFRNAEPASSGNREEFTHSTSASSSTEVLTWILRVIGIIYGLLAGCLIIYNLGIVFGPLVTVMGMSSLELTLTTTVSNIGPLTTAFATFVFSPALAATLMGVGVERDNSKFVWSLQGKGISCAIVGFGLLINILAMLVNSAATACLSQYQGYGSGWPDDLGIWFARSSVQAGTGLVLLFYGHKILALKSRNVQTHTNPPATDGLGK